MEVLISRASVEGTEVSKWFALVALLVATGCTGKVADGSPATSNGSPALPTGSGGSGAGSGTGSSPSCTAPSPGRAPLRRLSNAEYRNTLNDLFSGVSGISSLVATATSGFPAEPESLGFRNSAEFLTVQPLLAQKYMDAAEAVAAQAAPSAGLVPCTPQAGQEMDCARSFIQAFGKRAFRRPLAAAESALYETQFQTTLTSYDFNTAVEWVIYSMLQAPAFLYRVEAGEPGSAVVTRPTADEMASRLAYLFWQSAPDAALLQAAEAGALDTALKIEAQARRMLADPRAARLFQYFSEWLDLDRLEDFSRDATIFANLPSDLPTLYQAETRAFVASILARPDGSFTELVTAPYTYANQKLAAHYGLSGPSGTDFVRVDDPGRSGVLTQAMLMVQDKPYRTSIVRRGLKLRTDFLCQLIPAPPNNVNLNLDAEGPGLSQRDRLEQHRTVPLCASCHTLMDPVGLVFENFDAVGRYRSLDETGQAIVTSSEITSTRDANGPVANVQELGARLAASSEARDCYVTQTFRFFFGRDAEAADACTVSQLRDAFTKKNFSLSELLVALTQSDAFLYRPALPEVLQ